MDTDLRLINAATIRDFYPLEDMMKIVEWLARRKIFSGMDMQDGYWGVPLRSSDRYLTAVRTAVGLVQYCVMGMGLRNAAPTYQCILQKTLADLLWRIAVCYQDDLDVATVTSGDHIRALREVFAILRCKGFAMKKAVLSFFWR